MGNVGHPVKYLQICFKAFYYLGVFPYKVYLNDDTNQFQMVQHPGQKTVCILNFTISVLLVIFNGREVFSLDQNINYDPLIYFKMANVASSALFLLTVYISLWCRSKEYLYLFNHLHNLENTIQSRRSKKALLLGPLILCTILVYPTANFFAIMHRNGWDWNKTLEFTKGYGIKMIFLENFSSVFENNIPISICFAAINFLFHFSFILITTFGEILLLNCAVCMSDVVNDFRRLIQEEESNLKALEHYESMRHLQTSINNGVGVIIFGEVLASMPYFVGNFVDFIHPPNIYLFILHLIEFGNIFGFICLGANVHRKAKAIEEWILEHRDLSHLSQFELNVLLHNISGKELSFNGAGFFQITSGFLGSFVSLLLTFSVILIQFKNCEQSGCGEVESHLDY